MPALFDHQSSSTTKMLFLGDSGAGKTGALASLAAAGYNLRILDVDNGVDILANILRDPKSRYGAEALSRVWVETITDRMKLSAGGRLVPAKATVWDRSIKLLDNWKVLGDAPKDPEGKPSGPAPIVCDYGPVASWSPQDILVIDSLSMLCNAAMNFVLSLNARLGGRVEQSDWYTAQQMIEGLLQMLYDDGVRCNVIVNCHIAYIGEDNGPQRGYPQSLGKALSPKIGRYFNTALMAKTTGSGASQKRQILTGSTPLIELKNTNPLKVPASFPLETGLADYFKLVRGEGP